MPTATELDALSVEEKVRRLEAYQRLGVFHPLTCGNDSGHALLVPSAEDGALVLACPTAGCGYRQTDYVPPSAYARSVEELEEYAATLNGKTPTPETGAR